MPNEDKVPVSQTSPAIRSHPPLRGVLLNSLTALIGTASLLVSVACAQYSLRLIDVPTYDWTLELLLTVSIAAVAVVVGVWLTIWAAITVLCLSAATIGRRSHRLERLIATRGPAIARRLVATALGLGLTFTATPAFASADDATGASAPSAQQLTAATGLAWQNSPPAGETLPDHTPPAAASASRSNSEKSAQPVVVQPRESLWSIAAHHLPEDATAAQIAAAWPQWFDLNQQTIGTDPNVIVPGQKLSNPQTPN